MSCCSKMITKESEEELCKKSVKTLLSVETFNKHLVLPQYHYSQPIEVLHNLLRDPARRYISKLCHMEAWQFLMLAKRLKPFVERPRRKRDGL